MTIRMRFTLLQTAVTLVVLAIGGILYVKRLNLDLERGLNDTLSARADLVTSELRGNGSNLNVPHRVGTSNGIYTQLITVEGRLLRSSRELTHQPVLTARQVRRAVTNGSLIVDTTVSLRGPGVRGPEPMRILAVRSGRPAVVVAVAISRDVVNKAGRGAAEQLVIFGVIVVLIVAAGSWWITGGVLRPVERMRARVAALAQGDDTGGKVSVPGTGGEMGRLAVTLNDLLRRLHAALSRERAFVADVGHELRTPLTVLKGELELAGRPGRSPQELSDTVAIAAQETDRLVRLTEDLLMLASDTERPRLRRRDFDLTDLARVAIEAFGPLAAAAGSQIVLATADPVHVTADPARIRQAIDNLISNAVRYTSSATTVTITAEMITEADLPYAQLSVADDGPGFRPQFLPVAFERFTRAAQTRDQHNPADADPGGTGLGLAIVRSVMTAHGGTATATNQLDGGARVTLQWPSPANPAWP